MDTRHAVAYGLIAALLIGAVVAMRLLRRAARRERREAQRPIHITRDEPSDD
jgi:uncharacterized membrane-anchored protein YhcB (DUF1043 family)